MGSSSSGGWHEVAAIRAGDIRMRLVFAVFIALAGVIAEKGAAWPLIWLVASAAAQVTTYVVARPVLRDRSFIPSPRRRLAILACVALSATIFACAGALFWFLCGWGGRLFAVIIMAGGALHVALQAGANARLLWVGAAPFMVMLQLLPLISIATAPEAERGVMGMTAFAATLFVAHLAAAGRRSIGSARKLERALRAARGERRRAEIASAAKSDFLAVMSHELRTPLNGVLGMAQAMAAEDLSPDQRERLGVLRRSGESLLLLLNDVLDIAQIDTARLKLDRQPIDVAALGGQTCTVFGPLAEAKGLAFGVDYASAATTARLGDATRVRQVLHNLVGNAIKFTPAGAVTVTIRGDAGGLTFEVADSGPGMSAERIDGLFEPFDASDASAGRRQDGSGLGLGIARGLAQLMGGDVTVRSKLGEGSVFTARLALPEAEDVVEPAALTVPLAAELWRAGERLRVLAAEDNPTNRLVLKTLLEQLGVAVHIVGDGAEVIAAWREAPWDLVLMDIRMPGVDGVAATRAIRTEEAATGRPRTPIIAVTADATAPQAADYLGVGMDGLAPKPIQLPQLVAVINATLGAAAAERDFAAARSAA
ncbi:ATP-binding protein [Phenylobacterium sp. LjRoot219]|uniref:ATP-binding protein n=1 Tax=Phenylobacterium sp. LjRoot219 TaxID=3342283 RepID=UPI003ED13EA6